MDYTLAIVTLKSADPVLALILDRVGPCHLYQGQQSGDLLSALGRSIIHQQLSTKVATIIHQRFLNLYPDQAFPPASELLDTPDEVLRSAGLSGAKVRYLKDLAQKVQTTLPSLAELETWEDEAILQTVTQVKGIGRWSGQMFLMFRLHRWDVLPVDDLGIRAAVKQLYGLPELPDRQRLETLGQVWRPYRTIACWYLWRSRDLPPLSTSALSLQISE